MNALKLDFDTPADAIRWMAENILAVSDTEFAGEEKLRDAKVSFADFLPRFHEIKMIAKGLMEVDLAKQSPDFLAPLKESLANVYNHVFEIVRADVLSLARNAEPNHTKGRLIQNLQAALTALYSTCGIRLSFLFHLTNTRSLEPRFETLQNENKALALEVRNQIGGIEREARKSIEAFNAEFAERKKQLDEATKAVADLAKSAGVTVQAEHFNTLQVEYRSREKFWFKTTVAMIFGAVAYVLFEVRPALNALGDNASAPSIVSHTLPRVLIFSAIYFAIVWATRNMAAASHNWVINKHRVAALNTLRAFREGAENDKPTRLAILIQVTSAIFSPQASGYLKEEPLPQEKSVVEIINKLAGGAGGKEQ